MTDDSEFPAELPVPPRHARRGARPRRPVTVVGVLGELLITGGVLVLLFLGWQLWWNDMIMANAQTNSATDLSQNWIQQSQITAKPVDPTTPPAEPQDFGEPVVATPPAETETFAVMYVPRFGADYHRTIASGVGTNVLNSSRSGIGHYPSSQMPGEVGNFAVAAHRSANGGALHLIHELQLGDAIYVQTADGYYTYRFRDLEYVQPTAVDVIGPVPGQPEMAPVDRFITLTTCNPFYSTAERIIAYGVFESWQPLSAGAPTELASIIAAQAKG
ncbi:class E sortase [Glaciibacter psychrotolerans]|uniref:Sortase A n=1 Tax=Glaciibacter psychrotolerans TaxID=670054 RepID=A0A7Z0J7K9_9MICO|nr:class E sortase [Leifsonia psychrotolerans]NYJ20989.1 sortase A [Leifsonia psychrotolerans]